MTNDPVVRLAELARTGDLDGLLDLIGSLSGVDRDEFSYKWLSVAADFGHTAADDAIDDLLESGDLRHDDDSLVAGNAHFELAVAYLTGSDGLPVDYEHARRHLAEMLDCDFPASVQDGDRLLADARYSMDPTAQAIFDDVVDVSPDQPDPLPGAEPRAAVPGGCYAALDHLVNRRSEGLAGVRPGLMFCFYSSLGIREIAPSVAAAFETYAQFVPADALDSRRGRSHWVKLTAQGRRRDLAQLRDLPEDYRGLGVEWAQHRGTSGDVGEYEVLVNGSDWGLGRHTVLSLGFPFSVLEEGIEPLIRLLVTIAEQFPHTSGGGGCGLHSNESLGQSKDRRFINATLQQYHGFDHSLGLVAPHMDGRVPAANWLTFVSRPLCDQLGGVDTLVQTLPTAEVTALTRSVMIRAAEWPPLGHRDGVNDLGVIPDVARVLKPLRFATSSFGGDRDSFDPAAWLARFDNLPSSEHNRPISRQW